MRAHGTASLEGNRTAGSIPAISDESALTSGLLCKIKVDNSINWRCRLLNCSITFDPRNGWYSVWTP
jgi:hypothetical protein